MCFFVAGRPFSVIFKTTFQPMPKHCVKLKELQKCQATRKIGLQTFTLTFKKFETDFCKITIGQICLICGHCAAKLNSHRKAQNSRWVESEVIYLAHKEGVKTTEFLILKYSILRAYNLYFCQQIIICYNLHSHEQTLLEF